MDVLNRQSFQQLAATRLEDAKILIANECFAGAFYLAGYVVECGLKACICRLTREHDFPDKKRASDSHSHSLVKLFDIAQVPEDKLDADPELQRNWALAYNKLVCRDAIWRSDEHGSRQPVARSERSGPWSTSVVTRILVEEDKEAGRALTEELDRQQVPVSASLWLYDDADDRYRLTIATSIYDGGPLEAYRRVQQALDRLDPKTRPSLSDINIVSPDDAVVQAIRKAVRVPGIGSVQFNRTTVSGIYIEDAWIYRSD